MCIRDREYYAIVESALKEARDTCLNSFINYKVVLSVSSEEIRIRPQACGNISVSYDEERCRNLLTFNVKAFGDFDFRYVINQKANYIRHLLCIYTNAIFQVAIVGKSVEDYECADTGWQEYDYNWVDTSDIFVSETELLLSPDFYRILNFVLKDIQYERSLRLILNSAQQLFIANLMKRDAFSSGEYNICLLYTSYLHPLLMEKTMNQKPSLHQMEHYQKFYENGEYVWAVESTTEQNYNMIDGCANDLPKPRIINGRESVLDKL